MVCHKHDMSTTPREYTVDKAGWPDGPWNEEPDRTEWTTRAGLPAIAVRQGSGGHWCGYVGVPPGHPLHGKDYSDESFPDLEVHCGITYASKCQGEVCHVPKPGESDDVWWLGFDCAHSMDLSPRWMEKSYRFHEYGATYKQLGYVQGHCETLAKQLAEMS